MKIEKIIPIGAALAALGVILGAFGTHGLRGKIEPHLLQVYETATYYLVIHAIALILYGICCGLWRKGSDPTHKPWPANCFLIGTLLFSGSLYLITFTEVKQFGMITPLGGLLYIAGWIGFALQGSKS